MSNTDEERRLHTHMRPNKPYTYAITGDRCYCYPHRAGGQGFALLWEPTRTTVAHDEQLMAITRQINDVLLAVGKSPPSSELELSLLEVGNALVLAWSETIQEPLVADDDPKSIAEALGLPMDQVSPEPDRAAHELRTAPPRPPRGWSFVLRPSGVECFAGGRNQFVTGLLRVKEPTAHHDSRLVEATTAINELLRQTRSFQAPRPGAEICFIKFQNRLMLVWSTTHHDAVWAGDSVEKVEEALNIAHA